MYVSRYNYLSPLDSDREGLLLNPLSRSADIVTSDERDLLLSGDADDLGRPQLHHMIGRGYAFPSERDEWDLLLLLHRMEMAASRMTLYAYADVFAEEGRWRTMLRALDQRRDSAQGDQLPPLVLLNWEDPPADEALDEVLAFFSASAEFVFRLAFVVSTESLPAIGRLLPERQSGSILLRHNLPEHDGAVHFPDDTIALVTRVLDAELPLTLDVTISEDTVSLLKPLADNFIRHGWPFCRNFRVRLVPADAAGCLFGLRYLSDARLLRQVLVAMARDPQIEMFSLERWSGANTIHSLVWKGVLAPPTCHFCQGSMGLLVFRNGHIYSCVATAEAEADGGDVSEGERGVAPPLGALAREKCHGCRFLPACGGGCDAQWSDLRSVPSPCPPMEELLGVAIETYLGELLHRSRRTDSVDERKT